MTIKLGELLLKAGVVTEAQLKQALDEQRRWGGKLGEILVRMTFLDEETLTKALSRQLGIPRAELEELPPISRALTGKIPRDVARDLQVVPLKMADDKTLVVAMVDPTNLAHQDTLTKLTRLRLAVMIAAPAAIARMIARSYDDDADGVLEGGSDSPFKVVDAQGNTVVKDLAEVERQGQAQRAARSGPQAQPRAGLGLTPMPAPMPAAAAPSAEAQMLATLGRIEEAQRTEVTLLRAMVELLIEKGVFSRDEYLARLRR